MFSRILRLAACLAPGLVGLAPALALGAAPDGQTPASEPPGVVWGNGQVIQHPAATALRIVLKPSAKGKNVDEAFARFQELTRAATEQLVKLGAEPTSIRLEAYRAVRGASTAQGATVRPRMSFNPQRGLSGGAKKPAAEKATVVSAMLSAEFPLGAGDAESQILAGQKLQARITEAKLASPPKAEAAKDAAEEDEAEDEESESFGQPQRDPNSPVLLFVARPTPEEQAKSLREAVGKARQNAEESAATVKGTLGAPLALRPTVIAAENYSQHYYEIGYEIDNDFASYSAMSSRLSAPPDIEARANSPEQLSVTYHVWASFTLQGSQADAGSSRSTRSLEKGK